MPTMSTPARSAQAALSTSLTATITSRSPAAFFAARSGIVSFLRASVMISPKDAGWASVALALGRVRAFV